MSAKTKIVVLHMKELIYTGIFVALGILFVVLLIMMFLPGDKEKSPAEESVATAASVSDYIPGIYTTELILGTKTLDVEVVVDQTSIVSIQLRNIDDDVSTMYPLLEPAFDSLCSQIYTNQTLDNITYSAETKYTSLVLLEAIRNSLEKAISE